MEGAMVSPQLHSPRASTVVIAVPGELDIANAAAVEAALLAADASGADEIVVDLSGLRFMGSVGLRLLLEADERAQARGRRLTLRASAPVRRIIDLAGLTATLPVAA
jgi:anti-anti-sigma factor